MTEDLGITARPWLAQYPDDVPADIEPSNYGSLSDLLEESFAKFSSRPAMSFKGVDVDYATVHVLSTQLAAYLQSLGLAKGDRVAVMLPNVPHYLVVVSAILRAGFVLVNVNPLYTPRELEHQLKDCGALAMVILDRLAATLEHAIDQTLVEQVILCTVGESLSPSDDVVEPGRCASRATLPFRVALTIGASTEFQRAKLSPSDIAVLQYTGGTTGVSKGAILLHRNLIANVLQTEAWLTPALKRIPPGEALTAACMLPLYHVFAFVVNMLLVMRAGGKTVLVLDARNPGAALADIRPHAVHLLPGLSTLFAALMAHPDFVQVDWSHLKATLAGGMPTSPTVARRWKELTGCSVCEGYGLTETSASVTSNPVVGPVKEGTIGLPLPSTYLALLGDDGEPVPAHTVGQIAVKGPQLMQGYWCNEAETRQFINKDGFFLTGDLGIVDASGYFSVVDRQKDMILVSGFNVYPSEIEAVVAEIPGVVECAAIAVQDAGSGEAVKLVVVVADGVVTPEMIQLHCRRHLTGYKQPRIIEFRQALPKSPVGKILRRALREAAPSNAANEPV